jgi:PIN domain nuclease of toxin-antitoxin system
MLNLDTNIVLAILEGQLLRDEVRALESDSHWAISAMVLWEIGMLHKSGRLSEGLQGAQFLGLLEQLQVLPLTLEIARQSHRLDFDADPADEIIAATSIVHEAPLVTRDTRITGSKIVPLAVK